MWREERAAAEHPRDGGHSEELPVLAPAELPDVRAVLFKNSTRVYSHYNEAYSIATIFRSASEVYFRGNTYAGAPQLVAMMEPDGVFRHVRIPIAETVGKLHIAPVAFEGAARELDFRGSRPQFKTMLVACPPLFCCLARLHECLERDSTVLERQSRFAECVRLIVEHGVDRAPRARRGPERSAVRRARELLHARFSERVTLDELSNAAGISIYHLSRVFVHDVGIPPHTYQNHLRLAKARELLVQGVAAGAVAAEVGFSDQSHLTRQFRRTLGFTPGAYAHGTRGLRDVFEANAVAR